MVRMKGEVGRFFSIGVVVLAVTIGLLAVGGRTVRRFVASAFTGADQIRVTRALASDALAEQLDAETGIRGYAATRDPLFLEPYAGVRPKLDATLRRLAASLKESGMPAERDDALSAAATSSEWFARVAAPIIATHGRIAKPIQLQGKKLVDAFRADIDRINDGLSQREQSVSGQTAQAIDRINALIAASIGITLAIAVLLLVLAARASVHRERDRLIAAKVEREVAALRAAYAAEKRIADTLQDAFAQRPLPTLPTLRFSATYVPATEEARIGGDWYDALELPGKRVLFAIGDVTGHGIDAAVTMNRARHSLISSALLDADPASVLQRVNRDLLGQDAPMVTAVAGFADARTYEFVYSTAGHPPPVLLEPGRPARLLDCGSLPMGAIADVQYQTYRVQTVPGAMLVLYTDGAIEHSRNVLEGEAALLRAATDAMTEDAAESATFIHNAIFRGRPVGDDVAILTIGFATDLAEGLTVSADQATSTFGARINRTAQAPSRAADGRRRIAA